MNIGKKTVEIMKANPIKSIAFVALTTIYGHNVYDRAYIPPNVQTKCGKASTTIERIPPIIIDDLRRIFGGNFGSCH